MKVIVAGCGRVGDAITEFVSKEGHDVTVIDVKDSTLMQVVNNLDVFGVEGNCASYEILKEAGAEKADILISTTASDEVNIMACLIAKKLGTQHTMARVRNPEYSKQITFMREHFGLDLVFNPEREAATEISRIIQFPNALHNESFAKGKVNMIDFLVSEESVFANKKLIELSSLSKEKVLVCAVQRDEEVFIPSGDFEIKAGDIVSLSAPLNVLYNFFKQAGALKKKIKTIAIVGGGTIAYYLSQMLTAVGLSVTIIEKDKERSHLLAENLPKVTVINADGADSRDLFEEGLQNVDACVALTGLDEENLVIALMAKSFKVGKIIAKITKDYFFNMISTFDLDCSLISPKYLTASHVLRYVRGIENSQGSSVEALYKVMDNSVEALQFVVGENFKHCDIPLKELKLKKNLLIASIIRGTEFVQPHGDTVIKKGDRVVVVTTNLGLRDLADIME